MLLKNEILCLGPLTCSAVKLLLGLHWIESSQPLAFPLVSEANPQGTTMGDAFLGNPSLRNPSLVLYMHFEFKIKRLGKFHPSEPIHFFKNDALC